ncbi:efflux RND transporter permease subunit [Mesorhizobium sp. INR15]|uniref:efflux RND transporter permease subunit n=1 Tax=Mesorhizobium sp. INR15 TaxID=2654248 RepID=UPI00189661E4|nr:efflux RND transporter permease subunit [Mesorhizobium sp. INR15]QPC94716.1 hypothetical protein GA829_31235 [Mesorhizobium sp. INR15]
MTLAAVADISFDAVEGKAERLDRKGLTAVEANPREATLRTAMNAIMVLPALTNLPPSVSMIEYGDVENMSEMFRSFALALLPAY